MQANALLQATPASYIREILAATRAPGMISFAGGLPDPQLFPMSVLQECAATVFSDPDACQYGTTEGDPALRQWLADQHDCAPEQILITSGSQQALDLIARAFISPGDKVVVETPCYLGALQVFQLAGADIVTVPQTAEGPCLASLEAALAEAPKLFYAVPDFHNPTGLSWSAQTRKAVVELLNRFNIPLIEDAPYRALRFDGDMLPSLYESGLAEVFYLGSFSKVATPGMRVGYAMGPAGLIDWLKRVKQVSDLHTAIPMQRMVHQLVQHEAFAGHLQTLRQSYRHKRDVMAEALDKALGDRMTFQAPEGGMFFWASVPGVDTTELSKRALAEKVAIVPGRAFDDSGASDYSLRLNFSHATPELITEGVNRLATALSSFPR